jgi:hypothetical protein
MHPRNNVGDRAKLDIERRAVLAGQSIPAAGTSPAEKLFPRPRTVLCLLDRS